MGTVNRDGDPSTPTDRRVAAGARARELAQRRSQLDAGMGCTAETAHTAAQRSESAYERAARAHLAAAAGHVRAATAHIHAAEVHERAAAQGLGDRDAHRTAAAHHRRAAHEHDLAGVVDRGQAAADFSARRIAAHMRARRGR